MTDSENSQPQDDPDEDIYKDIPEFNFEDELAKLEGSKETYKQEANDLSEKVRVLTQENKELKKLNEVMKKNLSTLLKTAQAEVQRKDSMIEELRSKLQSFTFRRCKKSTSDKLISTDDLISSPSVKQESEKQKSVSKKKRSNSYEHWSSSESEWRYNQEEEKKINFQPGKEVNSNCGEKKSGYNRETTQSPNFWNSESNSDTHSGKHKRRKSTKYEDSSGHRKAYWNNQRDHLPYHSYDKKRNSRSTDNRFLSRRRHSRERRRDERSQSCERRKRSHRRDDSSDRTRRRSSKKEKSHSLEGKRSALEKPKLRFSVANDLVDRTKQEVLKSGGDNIENKKRMESGEKKKNVDDNVVGNGKNKQNKEKCSGKSDKGKNLEIFNTKSPLDALYNDMVSSRSISQVSNSKGGIINSDSDVEEGELFVIGNGSQKTSQGEEDWTLSFKNERQCETKPVTLYSRRMMQKFSSELKEKQLMRSEEETRAKEKAEHLDEPRGVEKTTETEKEPGELTDDENIIESSKEFKELTKMAALESEIIKESATESPEEPLDVVDFTKVGPLKELEKLVGFKEESATCKEIESSKETCDVIEFSPFKNNYKLIEISPIKRRENGHILDFYNNKVLPTNRPEHTKSLDASEEKTEVQEAETGNSSNTSEEKDSWKNSSENNLGTELKTVIPSARNSDERERADDISTAEEKESQKKEEKELPKKEENKSKTSEKEINLRKGKRRPSLKKETEKLLTDEGSQKRKRKFNDEAETKSGSKKLKLEKSESPRRDIRTKLNSKTETESQHLQEVEVKPMHELENKVSEDTAPCEFLRTIAGTDAPEIPVDIAMAKCPATDFKMTATMSVTGVVRLETPNKCIGKLKNLMINEQMIFNILDSKNNSQFSPVIGSKSIEMTPRRMLKNDLMLTDSEDDSVNKRNGQTEGVDEVEREGEEDEEEGCVSGSENSDCGSDSGASDFVDLL